MAVLPSVSLTHLPCPAPLSLASSRPALVSSWLLRCCFCCISHLQSCLTLCDPMDYSPPGFSVHGILQARRQKWVVMSFSRGSSQPRNQGCVSYVSFIGRQILYHQRHLRSLTSKIRPPETEIRLYCPVT